MLGLGCQRNISSCVYYNLLIVVSVIHDPPDNGSLLRTRLPWIAVLEYLIQLFKGATFGLDKEQVDEDNFEEVEENEEYIEPVLYLMRSALRTIQY